MPMMLARGSRDGRPASHRACEPPPPDDLEGSHDRELEHQVGLQVRRPLPAANVKAAMRRRACAGVG